MSAARQRGDGPVASARHALHNWRTRAQVQRDWRSRLPDFLVLGTARGGTTSLFRYLRDLPDAVPASRKEVNFFNREYHRGKYWYAARFPARRPGTLHFECTPLYLHWPEAPHRVRALLPECRFVVLLRDPVRRAISHYHQRPRFDAEPASLVETLEAELRDPQARVRARRNPAVGPAYLYAGLYARHLERWFDDFPRDRFFITASEELWAPGSDRLHELVRWLGLQPSGDALPPGSGRTPAEVPPPALLERLHEFYREPNERLAALLGWRPTWA